MFKWIFYTCIITLSCHAQEILVIGSKRFTESYILGEILTQIATEVGEASVEYRPGLGNTGIIFAALKEGAIDIYPEYTGTLQQEILKLPQQTDLIALRAQLEPLGLGIDIPLGFHNSYALAISETLAAKLHIENISDLLRYPDLTFGFSPEFMQRTDGWEPLRKTYGLRPHRTLTIDHSLAYEALYHKQIDVMDIYSTDAKMQAYELRILKDDRHFFPAYEAVLVYRLDVPQRFPKTWQAFQQLQGFFSNAQIIALNARAELKGENFTTIAKSAFDPSVVPENRSFWSQLFGPSFWTLTWQHLFLVFGSLLPAIMIGIPLGISAAYLPHLKHIILHLVGMIQTIPSLALLAFLIPLLQQIGTLPALIALFLYALLPIVRNTYAGLTHLPSPLTESARALGLPLFARLLYIEIPLALPTILAGIKTAAVVNVGTATLAALIGAGGFGERILSGLALNNYIILLSGAIPACILAICVQLMFDCVDRWMIPKSLSSTYISKSFEK